MIKPVDSISVPYPISWVDEERDCSSWLGNVLQQEAFRKINEIGERVRLSQTRRIRQDWYYLQSIWDKVALALTIIRMMHLITI